MSHRDVKPSDFVGKTVLRVDARAINIVRFWFTDGTTLALEHERDGISAGPLWRWLGNVPDPWRVP